jgi:hypothetical protein
VRSVCKEVEKRQLGALLCPGFFGWFRFLRNTGVRLRRSEVVVFGITYRVSSEIRRRHCERGRKGWNEGAKY